MKSNNLSIRTLKKLINSIAALFLAIFIAFAIIAILCGDGDRGIINLINS